MIKMIRSTATTTLFFMLMLLTESAASSLRGNKPPSVPAAPTTVEEILASLPEPHIPDNNNNNNDNDSNNVESKHRSLFVSTANEVSFGQVGSSFGGSGRNVATNTNADTVAVSTFSFFGGSPQPIQVYTRGEGSAWALKGTPIDLPVSSQKSNQVYLNGDGSILAVLSIERGSNNNNGTVLVYQYNATGANDWSSVGTPIEAGSLSRLTWNVAISDAGNILAVGKNGTVEIYSIMGDMMNDDWMLEDTIVDSDGINFGDYISLSHDGSVLAIGAQGATNSKGHALAGKVVVYKNDTITNTGYQPLGQVLEGTKPSELLGMVALTGDGTKLAVGSWNANTGGSVTTFQASVQVFGYAVTDNAWEMTGDNDIIDEDDDYPLYQLSINDDGDRVLITTLDEARLYELHDGDHWFHIHDTTERTVSATLNGVGNTIVLSTYNTGTVSVYREQIDPSRTDGEEATRYFEPACTEPVPFGYRFLSQKESPYMDYSNEGGDVDVATLADKCDQESHICKGFNSKGLLKMEIRPVAEIVTDAGYEDVCEGLYIKLDCTPVKAHPTCKQPIPCGYDFVPGKEMQLYIYNPLGVGKDVFEYAAYCDADPKCEGFDSNGTTKRRIVRNQMVAGIIQNDPCWGTYIKKSVG